MLNSAVALGEIDCSVLAVKSATKGYGSDSLFEDLSFELRAGCATALVGENGSGKSTLLRCVAGTDDLDQGTVEIMGRAAPESDAAVRTAVAALLDDVDYFPDLSVLEHLRLVAWLHGVEDADTATDRIVHEVGLESVTHQLPPTLSSGQRHRLGLASCFIRPRELLLLDEPEQRLDSTGREWLRSRLRQEKSAGRAVLFASHDPMMVSEVADDVLTF